eukprot:scaffold62732_cov61-Phaeocystis_antarctica.AAC.1
MSPPPGSCHGRGHRTLPVRAPGAAWIARLRRVITRQCDASAGLSLGSSPKPPACRGTGGAGQLAPGPHALSTHCTYAVRVPGSGVPYRGTTGHPSSGWLSASPSS